MAFDGRRDRNKRGLPESPIMEKKMQSLEKFRRDFVKCIAFPLETFFPFPHCVYFSDRFVFPKPDSSVPLFQRFPFRLPSQQSLIVTFSPRSLLVLRCGVFRPVLTSAVPLPPVAQSSSLLLIFSLCSCSAFSAPLPISSGAVVYVPQRRSR